MLPAVNLRVSGEHCCYHLAGRNSGSECSEPGLALHLNTDIQQSFARGQSCNLAEFDSVPNGIGLAVIDATGTIPE